MTPEMRFAIVVGFVIFVATTVSLFVALIGGVIWPFVVRRLRAARSDPLQTDRTALLMRATLLRVDAALQALMTQHIPTILEELQTMTNMTWEAAAQQMQADITALTDRTNTLAAENARITGENAQLKADLAAAQAAAQTVPYAFEASLDALHALAQPAAAPTASTTASDAPQGAEQQL